jgi:broad specificity phosphatase PhoE
MQFIYVVRHGETDANVAGMVNDKKIEIGLNADGKKQAKKTGKYFKNRKLKDVIIYTSPSNRAIQTTELINTELKTEIIIDNRINEIDHGLMSGATKGDKIFNRYMKEFNKLPKDPIDFELSFDKFDKFIEKEFKTESIGHLEKRVKSFYNSLPKNKHIIVVTHSGISSFTIRVLFNILQAGDIKGDKTYGKNCTIMCITKEKNKYKLLTLPNTLHLK